MNNIINKYHIVLVIIIIIIIIYILLYAFKQSQPQIEPFQSSSTLTSESVDKFLKIQTTINRNTNFDTQKLQEQVTQSELDYFLKHGKWQWSPKVIDLYKKAIKKNVFIRTTPHESIAYARTIYNQNAILQLLSLQTKEGRFLTTGLSIHSNKPNPLETLPSGFGTFGYNSGLIGNRNDVIRCNIDPFGNNSYLEKIHFTGKGGIFNEQTNQITHLNYKYLENEIPGFEFLNKPCNPCKAFNNPADYSCRFKLNNIPDESPGISSVWKYLWSM